MGKLGHVLWGQEPPYQQQYIEGFLKKALDKPTSSQEPLLSPLPGGSSIIDAEIYGVTGTVTVTGICPTQEFLRSWPLIHFTIDSTQEFMSSTLPFPLNIPSPRLAKLEQATGRYSPRGNTMKLPPSPHRPTSCEGISSSGLCTA